MTNGYLLALAVTLITISEFGDRFGHRKVFLTGIVGFAATSAAAGLSGAVITKFGPRVPMFVGTAVLGAIMSAKVDALLPARWAAARLPALNPAQLAEAKSLTRKGAGAAH